MSQQAARIAPIGRAIAATAATALIGAALAAGDPFSFGFSAGERPVDPRSPAVMQRVAGCAECHPRQHSAWAGSRHGLAWTNPLFSLAFADEPRRWCVNCHAPLAAQAAEVRLDLHQRRLTADHLIVELADGSQEKRLILDTALRPDAPAVFPWAGGRWRLRYHYASAEEEQRRRLPAETIVWTGWAGG